MKRIALHMLFILLCLEGMSQTYFDRFITDTIFRSAHLGVAVYDPESGKYLNSYQSDKYFIPASNIKIFTCYAALKYLPDSVKIQAEDTWWRDLGPGWAWSDDEEIENYFPYAALLDSGVVWQGPVDSLLRPMMHHSDNYLAEQLLRTVLKEKIQIEDIVKSLFPVSASWPKWVDGCGLSRYNLFTPQQLITVLDSIYGQFGIARVKTLFSTGAAGTLKYYYTTNKGTIYAKTGSLTGVIALSGYLIKKSGKPILFSILVNNYNGSGLLARRRIEKFVKELIQHRISR